MALEVMALKDDMNAKLKLMQHYGKLKKILSTSTRKHFCQTEICNNTKANNDKYSIVDGNS